MAEPAAEQSKWYAMAPEAVAGQLKVDPAKGLSTAEAQQRLQQYGPNELAAKKKEPGWQAFLRQYRDFMQWILLGAAVLSVLVGQNRTALALVILTVFPPSSVSTTPGLAYFLVAALLVAIFGSVSSFVAGPGSRTASTAN